MLKNAKNRLKISRVNADSSKISSIKRKGILTKTTKIQETRRMKIIIKVIFNHIIKLGEINHLIKLNEELKS